MTKKYLCFADVGTKVRLEEDWTFGLYMEHRNKSLGLIFCEEKWKLSYGSYNTWGKVVDFFTLPAGTELLVERVYIRAQMEDFSSITFKITKIDDPRFYGNGTGKNKGLIVSKKARFWAKLADVNEAKMLIVDDKAADSTQEEEPEYDLGATEE